MDKHELRSQALENASALMARSIARLDDKRLEAVPVAPNLAKFLAAQVSHLKMALKEIEKARLLERQLVSGSALAAFERMEENYLRMQARSRTAAELAGADLETQFAMLESDDGMDDELRRLKEELLGAATPRVQPTSTSSALVHTVVDNELEALRTKLDDL